MSCYEQFGWTPDECKDVLRRYPLESELLSVYFEELSAYRGEEHAKLRRQAEHATEDSSWHTDQVFDDEDDEEE